MALDAAHRASIYEKLRPILGDEDANVLMTEFPSVEADELVTKGFLRAELGEGLARTRAELRDELVTKDFLRAELADLRGELRGAVGALESKLTLRLGSAIAASAALQITALGLLL